MTYRFNQFPVSKQLLSSTILIGAMAVAFPPVEAFAQDATDGGTQLAPIVVDSSKKRRQLARTTTRSFQPVPSLP